MKNVYLYFSLMTLLISLWFGGLAYVSMLNENMDQVYLNIGFCALFLSAMVFTLDLKDRKKQRKRD
ncbi:protein YpmT [Bacillus gobiensis]|uniref:protein YpmT n=1 Tax=Bacillus gobiensis TaxID=1441095 RepID=UPI003D1BEEC4